MTPQIAAIIVVGLGLGALLGWNFVRFCRLFREGYQRGRDVGLRPIEEDYTEDQPIGTIDEALAQTTDPAERDALLDVRLRAMKP